METFRPDLLFLDVVILSGQGIFKETTDFGSRVLSPYLGLEASQDCFGEKSQVGNLLKDGDISFMKIRRPLPIITCKHEPSMDISAFCINKPRMFKYI